MTEMTSIDEIASGCLAGRVRVIARSVTSIYEQALASHGISIAQVNLLVVIGKLGKCAPAKLGEILQLERSTVSRNLDLLIKNEWAEPSSSDAKGVREVKLTQAGRKKIDAVLPDWRAAQKLSAHLLGNDGVQLVSSVANGLMNYRSS